MKNRFIKIHPQDNVIVCLDHFSSGEVIQVDNQNITFQQDTPQGSKIAVETIPVGANVLKYGSAIGHAISNIETGDWVHTHNLKTNLNDTQSYQYSPIHPSEKLTSLPSRTFDGYQRANGEVGIRNEIWVIPTVGCVNGIAKQAIKLFEQEVKKLECDGVFLFSHNYGCSQLGNDHENTRKILANMVKHPNAGGVLVIGLGCENNQVDAFQELVGEVDTDRVKYMIAQKEEDEIHTALDLLKDIYSTMKYDRRTPTPIAKLKIGLECGGSDGLSGITANPLIGKVSDYLVTHGGTSVLTEVPEMFGAEHLLFERCADESVFSKAVAMVNNFKQYYIDHNQPIYENPSPGNKKGGISTLEDKSMGCTQKSGSGTVVDVLEYGEVLRVPGLNLLSAPGNDAVATSALGASGCHIVLFSTGRGTPYGGFVPTLKISTNTDLYNRKKHWIDFNAGELVDGTNMDTLLDKLLTSIVSISNGKQTKNEINDIRELAIFKSGVTL